VNQIGKNITVVEGRYQRRRDLDRIYETVKTEKGEYRNRFRQCWRAGRETSGIFTEVRVGGLRLGLFYVLERASPSFVAGVHFSFSGF
jgi:hypothetical protein